MARITLSEYAKMNGKSLRTVQQKAALGNFETAKKDENGRWTIDDTEEYIDCRTLKAKDIFNDIAYLPESEGGLSASQRRVMLKCEQAKEYSGFSKYPSTCDAIFAQIPDGFYDIFSAREIGEIAKVINAAYLYGLLDRR